MALPITASFTDGGVPATGLSPTIRIRRISDGVLVVTNGAMTEVPDPGPGDGSYEFDFESLIDFAEHYTVRADGTVTLPDADRYKFGLVSGPRELENVKLLEVHRRLGLLEGTPAVHKPDSIVAGVDQAQTVTTVGTTVTVSRDP